VGGRQTRLLSVVSDESKSTLTFNVKSPCLPQPVGVAEAVGDTDEVANVEIVLVSGFDVAPKASELLPEDKMLCADENAVLPCMADKISDVELAEDTNEAGLVNELSGENEVLSEIEVKTVSDDKTAVGDEVAGDVNITELMEDVSDSETPMLSKL
jgi:hypothetical protein